MTIKGSVDQIGVKGVSGWIYNTADSRPMVVEAVLHHRIVGEALADNFRHDLAEVGMGDGRCGFAIEFPLPLDAAYLPFVSLRPSGGDVELTRTSLSGYADFLATLYKSNPIAGRTKSVYGGLWTDRTDALAILEGRRSIHAVDDRTAAAIERLIVHGHVVLDLPSSEGHHAFSRDFSSMERRVAHMLFQHNVDDTLKAIFDDRPVAIHGDVFYEAQSAFKQACTGRALASPLDCVALLSASGPSSSVIEFVRDSHNFPDFTVAGKARWLLGQEETALAHASAIGSAVEVIGLDGTQVVLVAAGTLFRCIQPSTDGTVEALCVPSRQTPLRPDRTSLSKDEPDFAGQILLQ
jgi:hypothetical protein